VLTHDTDRRVRPCPEPGCRRPLLRQWRPVPSVEPGSISRNTDPTGRETNRLEQSLRPEPSAKPVPTREWRWKERGAGTNEPGRSRCDHRLENEAIDAAVRS